MNPSSEDLLAHAREMTQQATWCWVATVANEKEVHTRVVYPYPISSDWHVRFMTDRRTRKVAELRSTKWLTLSYLCDTKEDTGYVNVSGAPTILDSVQLKQELWKESSHLYFPGGPEDPNVVVIDVAIAKIELWNYQRGITPAPLGLSAVCMERLNDGWSVSASWPE